MAFSFAIIIILGLAADYLFRKIKLPGLIGMLIVGVLAGPYVLDLIYPEMMNVSGDFRKIALIVILLRAGFELRRDQLIKVGRTAVIMSMVPAVFEIAGVMLVAPKLLGLGILDAAILGSILAAVSPAVVVPLMINFMDQGRGAKKGIPTLILGASSLDDVFVIVLFSAFIGMYSGAETSLLRNLAEIPVSIIIGVIAGLIPGYVLYRLFIKYDWRPPKRALIVLGTAMLLTWLESACEDFIPVASLLGIMAIGYIILEKAEPVAHIISLQLKRLWVFAELLLFILVGAQVNIYVAWKSGSAGIIVILAGLVFRSIGTYLSLIGTPYNWKEKIFCIVAYIPKATVQAAIGAIPLSMGVMSGDIILAVSVLSIILTAPIGAIGIMILGDRVLDRGEKSVYRFSDLRDRMGLPRVGERVRNKLSGKIWKVIEEKEEWDDLSPLITIRFWKEEEARGNGKGKTVVHRFQNSSPLFEDSWEILYDW